MLESSCKVRLGATKPRKTRQPTQTDRSPKENMTDAIDKNRQGHDRHQRASLVMKAALHCRPPAEKDRERPAARKARLETHQKMISQAQSIERHLIGHAREQIRIRKGSLRKIATDKRTKKRDLMGVSKGILMFKEIRRRRKRRTYVWATVESGQRRAKG